MNSEYIKPPSYSVPESTLHFLASEDELYDYGNLYSFTAWLKKQLEAYNINEHHPLLLFAGSSDIQVFAIAACWLLRIPILPLSPSMTDQELERILDKIQPAAVITAGSENERVGNIPKLRISREKLTMTKIVDESQFSSGEPGKLLGYFLTSGSTGSPKIVPLKRRQMLFAAYSSAHNFKPDPDRYWLLCLPLNHVGGLSIILRSVLYHSAVFKMDTFDTEHVITFLTENTLFQAASMVPTMLHRLLNHSDFRVHKEIEAILLGGGAVTPSLLKKSTDKGLPIITSYGMTETCAQIAANPILKPSGIYRPQKSVGKVFSPNEVQIRNDNGEKLPVNEPGLIWLKGPQVFDGYLEEENNKGRFDTEGWFNTEDFGYTDRNNHLFIETRRSDLIITGGENVRPLDVESALEDHKLIDEAAVIGIADSDWGQVVVAFVTPANNAVWDEKQILDDLKQRLSPFKIPKKIIPIDHLPLTESGKTDKEKLARIFEKEFNV